MLLQTAYTDHKYQIYKNGQLCFEDECKMPALRYADKAVSVPKKYIKSFPVWIKRIDAATGIVDAIVAVIGNIDYGDDIIHPGAFTKTITERGLDVRVLDNHNAWSIMDVVGKPLLIREVGIDELPPELLTKYPDATGGLFTTTQYLMKTPEGFGAFERIATEAITEYSIGFQIIKQDYETVESDEGTREIRNIREIKLFEYSPVIWAMNPATQTISSAQEPDINSKAMDEDEEYKCASCKFYGMVTEDMGYCTLNNEAVKANDISDGYEAIEEILGALVSEDLYEALYNFMDDYMTMLSNAELWNSEVTQDEFLIATVENMLALFDSELLGARLPAPKIYTIPKSNDDNGKSAAAGSVDKQEPVTTAHDAMNEEQRNDLINKIRLAQIEAQSGGYHATNPN